MLRDVRKGESFSANVVMAGAKKPTPITRFFEPSKVERACQWPGCQVSISTKCRSRKWCDQHQPLAERKAQNRANAKIKARRLAAAQARREAQS